MLDSAEDEDMAPRSEDNGEDEADPVADASEDDAETAELSRLRCTSICTEEIADREKKKQHRHNRSADYPGLAFGSAAFGSETMKIGRAHV